LLERAALYSMGVYLFVLNLPRVASLREASFLISAALAAAYMWKMGRVAWPPMRLLLLMWLAFAFLSVIPGSDLPFSISEVKKDVVYPLMAFWVFYVMTKGERDFLSLSIPFLISAALVSLASFYAYFVLGLGFEELVDSGYLYGKRAYYSFFMLSAAIVAIGLAGCGSAGRRLKTLAIALVPVFCTGVYFARLRVGYLAIIMAAFLFFIYGKVLRQGLKRRILAGAVAASILVTLPLLATYRDLDFGLDIESMKTSFERIRTEERWIIWEGAVKEISSNPVFGRGFGNKEIYVPDFRLGYVYPHNILLSYGVMTGVAGIVLLMLIFGKLCWMMHAKVGQCASNSAQFSIILAGLVLTSVFFLLNMTEDIMTRHTGQLFWALTGMFLGAGREVDDR